MPTAAQINIKFKADLKQFSTKMQNVERSIKRMGRKMSNVGKGLSTSLTLPLIAVGGYALKSAADLETMEVAFESMLGSAKAAKNLTEKLINFTAKTPFQLDGVGKSAKQLLAFGVAEDEIIDKLKVLGDISSGATVPLSDMAAIFGKVKAKGKAMTEEILQMSDRGIPIIAVLAEQFGVAESAIFDMAKEGEISFTSIETALTSMTTKGGIFNDQMLKQSGTLAGLASTVKDNLVLGFAQLGTEIVKVFNLKELAEKFIVKIQGLVKAFANLSPVKKKVIVVVGLLVAALGPLLTALGFLMTTVVPGLSVVFGYLAKTVMPSVIGAFKSLYGVILANPITALVAAVAAIVYGFTVLVQKITPAVSKLKTFFNLIKSGGNYQAFVNYQMRDQVDAMANSKAATEEVTESQKKFNEQLKETIDLINKQVTAPIGGSGGKGERPTATALSGTVIGASELSGGSLLPEDQIIATVLGIETVEASMESLQQTAQTVGFGVSEAFVSMTDGLVDSLGLADKGFQGFLKGLLKTVTKLIGMLLANATANVITGATAAGTATGPAAPFTTPAFIAAAVAGISAAFAAIPKFATGGIIGGSSYFGDKILARLDSREMVLNTDQQKKLYGMIQPQSNNVNIGLDGSFELDGQKLKLVLDRVNQFDNRTS